MANTLFFVALLPPPSLRKEIEQLQLIFRDEYSSSHALKSPPHITLLKPFQPEKSSLPEVVELLEQISRITIPFSVRLHNFSAFKPHTIFIDVKKSAPLIELQQNIENTAHEYSDIFNYNYRKRSYHPHLSLAFRDLSETDFERAWQVFRTKKFKAEFRAKAFSLLKHDGERWQVEHTFKFIDNG